jgi:hypothetical protein
MASARVMPITADFEAQYAAGPGMCELFEI